MAYKGYRRRKSSGRASKLTAEHKKRLKRLLDRGALASGYLTDRWDIGACMRVDQKGILASVIIRIQSSEYWTS